MGHQVIQQPDGLLSVWSTIVDDFIIVDATKEELVDYYVEEAATHARERSEAIITAILAGHTRDIYSQFAMTYEEALERRQEVHG